MGNTVDKYCACDQKEDDRLNDLVRLIRIQLDAKAKKSLDPVSQILSVLRVQ